MFIRKEFILLLIEIFKWKYFFAESFLYPFMFYAVTIETLLPIKQCFIRWNTKACLSYFIRSVHTFRYDRKIKKRHISTRTSDIISKKQMIRMNIILVN